MASFTKPLIIVALLLGLTIQPALLSAQNGNTVPILVVVNDSGSSPYGRYLGEILRAEGLNLYAIKDLNAITSGDFSSYDLVILAETGLSSGQAALFNSYVSGGGRLLAMRPDAQIAGLFGLGAVAGTQSNGYLGIDGTATVAGEQPGAGLPGETLQIHGTADRYALGSGAVMVAQLYSNATTGTGYPAVVSNSSGRAVAFTYDLARNVIYTRQGNPANANVDADGDGVFRTIDLFQGMNGGAPWVDRDKIHLPQADIQQRLFARLVKQMVGQVKPLPQVWYFPGTAKTMLVLTGDAHANPTSYFQYEIDSLNTLNGKITLYVTQAADPVPAAVSTWITQGHSFGIHPYVTSGYLGAYSTLSSWFTTRFGRLPSRTVRNHQVAWLGWTDGAAIAASQGYALDANFYHWGPWLQKPDQSWPHGYITGSGQPMKFVAANGTIIQSYQQLTQLVDEQLVTGVGFENLSVADAIAVSQSLIDASQNGDYAALMTQFHVDYYGWGSPQDWAEGTLAYANSLGVPAWNADQWLNFTETRQNATFSNIAWSSATGQYTFDLSVPSGSNALSIMLPLSYGNATLTGVLVDTNVAPVAQFTVAGVTYGLVDVPTGTHRITAGYGATPIPPSVTPTNTPLPPTATATPLPPTATPTNTPLPPTATATPLPPTATPTNTPLPPTATPTDTPLPPTATATPLPPTATPTDTPLPPTATATPLPPTATNTPLPPTATATPLPPTATNTPLPPTATATPLPPTATNTPLPTATITPTWTATPTVDPNSNSQTATITATSTPVPSQPTAISGEIPVDGESLSPRLYLPQVLR